MLATLSVPKAQSAYGARLEVERGDAGEYEPRLAEVIRSRAGHALREHGLTVVRLPGADIKSGRVVTMLREVVCG